MGKTKVDPFAGLADAVAATVPAEPTDAIPAVLARRPSQAKRNRGWETQQRDNSTVATYRGIPLELQQQLRQIAEDVHVTVGEVVRAFLEHGLAAYQSGALILAPQLKTGKLTLYPEPDSPAATGKQSRKAGR